MCFAVREPCERVYLLCVLLCFIDPRMKKIRNKAFSCLRIFSRTLFFNYVANSPDSPLPHLLDIHIDMPKAISAPFRKYVCVREFFKE